MGLKTTSVQLLPRSRMTTGATENPVILIVRLLPLGATSPFGIQPTVSLHFTLLLHSIPILALRSKRLAVVVFIALVADRVNREATHSFLPRRVIR